MWLAASDPKPTFHARRVQSQILLKGLLTGGTRVGDAPVARVVVCQALREEIMTGKTLPITGGCLCGEVRFEATEPPSHVGYCHCRMCQKAYGHTSGIWVMFVGPRKGALRFTKGKPKYYKSSAWLERGFCSNCGSPVGARRANGHHSVLIGTLDHPEDWPPDDAHSGIESRIPWNVIHDGLPQCRTEDDPNFVTAKEAAEGREG